jgi:hypothetical protein
MVFRSFVEPRSQRRRWIYLLCSVVVLLIAILSAGMGGLVGGLVYLPIVAVCVVQFFKTTLLGWFLLVVAFSAYAVAVAAMWKDLTRLDLLVFFLIGFVPAVLLLLSWPRPVEHVSPS